MIVNHARHGRAQSSNCSVLDLEISAALIMVIIKYEEESTSNNNKSSNNRDRINSYINRNSTNSS